MKYVASYLISNIFFILAMQYITSEKLDFKKLKIYVCYATVVFCAILNYEFVPTSFRLIINVLIFVFLARFLFAKNWKDSIILGIFIFFIGAIAEFVELIFASSFIDEILFVSSSPMVVFINNLIIGIIILFFCYVIRAKKQYLRILKMFNKITDKKIVMFSLGIVIIFNIGYIVTYLIYKDSLNLKYLPLLSVILSFFSSVIVLLYLKINNKYLTFYEKYNISIESIREFETMIENYRINTHENRNQFRTIRNMSQNKKIMAYIDALLNEKINDDEKLLMDVQKIPAGGLRGIIYSKILLMKEKRIPFELVVDKKITMEKTEKIDDYTLTSICRILGVLLDNSIEEVSKLLDKCIMIELYEEDNSIVITITNNYEGYVDIDIINHPGQSTKGKNHGYGLALVQSLVKKNKKIQHTSEFFEDNFMQKIKIKV